MTVTLPPKPTTTKLLLRVRGQWAVKSMVGAFQVPVLGGGASQDFFKEVSTIFKSLYAILVL